MAATTGNGGGPITEINVTPFVDVVLVLLIIFMVTAPVMFQQSIPLTLPSAASGEAEPSVELGVTILADGAILLNGDRIDRDDLRARVAATDGLLTVLINADRATPHGTVVGVLDLLRQEGVENYAINVVPFEPESQPAD